MRQAATAPERFAEVEVNMVCKLLSGGVWTLWSATIAESIGEEGARYYVAKAGIHQFASGMACSRSNAPLGTTYTIGF